MKKILFFFLIPALFFSSQASAQVDCTPCNPCPPCYSAGVSFLYWQPSMSNLEYAAVLQTTILEPLGIPPKFVTSSAHIKNIDFSWDPGVRAYVAYNSPCSDWSAVLTGTYFHSKSHGENRVPLQLFVDSTNQIPLVDAVFMGNIVQGASADWTVDFGCLDLVASGSFIPWSCVYLMPNFGLRGLWLEQNYTANYDNVLFLTTIEPGAVVGAHADTIRKSRYRAIGIKMGTDFEVPGYYGCSLIGGIGGALFYGPVSSKTQVHGFNPETGAGGDPVLTTLNVAITDQIWQLRANIETELGLAYTLPVRFCQCVLSATYSFSLWFDQNDFYNIGFSPESTNPGLIEQNFINLKRDKENLQLQGLILQANLYF